MPCGGSATIYRTARTSREESLRYVVSLPLSRTFMNHTVEKHVTKTLIASHNMALHTVYTGTQTSRCSLNLRQSDVGDVITGDKADVGPITGSSGRLRALKRGDTRITVFEHGRSGCVDIEALARNHNDITDLPVAGRWSWRGDVFYPITET
mmetsp:Transcript_6001/g.23764  ORF Transcript_6001/g.23764 Transcript_6001/m.23764 type:complete len:152 (-) Transcript_6001:2257-2712(-)